MWLSGQLSYQTKGSLERMTLSCHRQKVICKLSLSRKRKKGLSLNLKQRIFKASCLPIKATSPKRHRPQKRIAEHSGNLSANITSIRKATKPYRIAPTRLNQRKRSNNFITNTSVFWNISAKTRYYMLLRGRFETCPYNTILFIQRIFQKLKSYLLYRIHIHLYSFVIDYNCKTTSCVALQLRHWNSWYRLRFFIIHNQDIYLHLPGHIYPIINPPIPNDLL